MIDTEIKMATDFEIHLCPECLEGELTRRGHCDECLSCGWRACSISLKV